MRVTPLPSGVTQAQARDLIYKLHDLRTVVNAKTELAGAFTDGNVPIFNEDGYLEDSGKDPPTGDFVGTTDTQTLTNKTLTAPTIDDFSNAHHDHQDDDDGGKLDHGLSLTGLTDDDHTQYVHTDGSRDINYTSGAWAVGNVTGGHYTEFEADGTMRSVGNATTWDDERVPLTSTKLGGVKDPGFSVAFTDGAGSTGAWLYWFDAGTVEELFFVVQLSHRYKIDTSIYPHVHWIPKTNGSAGQVVSWGLEYTWASIGAVFGNTTQIYSNAHSPVETLVAGKHYVTSFSAISPGAGKGISSMLICRVWRDATGTGLTDSYTDDVGLIEIDFHFEMDTLGSRSEFTK